MQDYLYDVEGVKNRPDKSVLKIHSQCPELLLATDVASPELVKHLELHLNFGYMFNTYASKYYKYRREGVFCECKCDEDRCTKCFWRDDKVYTDTLCKDLVNFKNLETLIARDLKLSTELWIQFARNSKCLEKLTFESEEHVTIGDYDDLQFGAYYDEQPPKNAALDAIVKIPTLKHLRFDNVNMRYFPSGPSSIESLYLNVVDIEKQEYLEENFSYKEVGNLSEFKSKWDELGFSNSFDLSGHQNLKDVTIEYIGHIKFSDLHLEKLENLETFYVHESFMEDEEDEKSLKAISKLPNMRKYEIKKRRS